MSTVALLVARDPLTRPGPLDPWGLARRLAGSGRAVVVLLEDAVTVLRGRHAVAAAVAAARDAGVEVWADQQALGRYRLACPAGVRAVDADTVVTLLVEEGTRSVWL